MKLIKQKYNKHVSIDTIEEFEEAITSDLFVTSVDQKPKIISKLLFLIYRFILRINNKNRKKPQIKNTFLSILMGVDFSKCFPYFMYPSKKNIYLFDAWPNKHKEIIEFLNIFKVDNLFLTSRQSTKLIQDRVNFTKCFWIPEAITPNKYKQYNYKDKTIDVLAIGRKYDVYHNQIVTSLSHNNKNYFYEKQKGELIFPTRKEFVEGLAKSKISICVPSSITHPERSGNIETMTVRYLQSMVSKCLILGKAPEEMVTLFGYNPVIEIDFNDPIDQIQFILENYSDYIPLIEKNYQTVLKNHTWENRWNEIKTILEEN